jgi:hypothetical protein
VFKNFTENLKPNNKKNAINPANTIKKACWTPKNHSKPAETPFEKRMKAT